MVEGPGCTRNGDKVRKCFTGRLVTGVAGRAGLQVATAARGRLLETAITLGKELWLIFSDSTEAIRLHFGMAGSVQCGSHQPAAQSRKQLTLLIRFESADGTSHADELRVYDSSAVLADAAAACQAVSSGRGRDVCSAYFDEDAAVVALCSAPAAWMIADVLLDQSVLPGVGNIIKNEALHRVGIDPRQCLRTLTREALAQLVRETRHYSSAWYRNGRHPACQVYNRVLCASCNAAVSFCKLGDVGAPRPTFWCSALCGGDPRASAGVTQSGRSVGKRKRSAGDDASLSASAIPAPVHSNPWEAAALSAASAKGVSGATASPPQDVPSSRRPAALSTLANGTGAPAALSKPCLPLCMLHGPGQISLRRVRNAGPNDGRLFYSCRGKGCNLFEWADKDFPRCVCPEPSTAGLRVSKRQDSGGRWFFGCRRDAKTRCKHFAWAGADVLQRFGGLLHPLT